MNFRIPVKKEDYMLDDYKLKPMPNEKKVIQFEYKIPERNMEIIKLGLPPSRGNERWIIYYEDNKAYFHRSWTYCVFIFEFLPNSIISLTLNQNSEQVNPKTIHKTYALDMLRMLFRHYKGVDIKKLKKELEYINNSK